MKKLLAAMLLVTNAALAEPMFPIHKGSYIICSHPLLQQDFLEQYDNTPPKQLDWMQQQGEHHSTLDLDQDGIPDTLDMMIAQYAGECNFYKVLVNKDTRVKIKLSHNNRTYNYTVLGGLVTKIQYPLGEERYVNLVGHDMHNRPWEKKLFFGDEYDNANKPIPRPRKPFKMTINGTRM